MYIAQINSRKSPSKQLKFTSKKEALLWIKKMLIINDADMTVSGTLYHCDKKTPSGEMAYDQYHLYGKMLHKHIE